MWLKYPTWDLQYLPYSTQWYWPCTHFSSSQLSTHNLERQAMKKCDQCDQCDPIPNTRPRPSSDSPVTEATSCLQNKVSKWIFIKLTKVKFPEVGWKYHGRGQILETRSIGRKLSCWFWGSCLLAQSQFTWSASVYDTASPDGAGILWFGRPGNFYPLTSKPLSHKWHIFMQDHVTTLNI